LIFDFRILFSFGIVASCWWWLLWWYGRVSGGV